MSKATVKADVWQWEERPGVLSVTWIASHDCNWHEHLNEWHNAFWAADHHVRYDCGRREQVSSGAVVMEMSGNLARLTSEQEAEFRRLWAAGAPYGYGYTVLNEGGMQNDPAPSGIGDPLPPASAEDATVELGCITTELGRVPGEEWEGFALEGWSEGTSGGSAGWWARVRGKGHGR